MPRKKVAIIGAGIAGLSTGIYARKAGYDTTIFEMHSRPGGLCTDWKRGEYRIDGCLHHLAGMQPWSPIHPVWQDLGILPQLDNLPRDHLVRIEEGNRSVTLYSDPDRLESHLVEIAPNDRKPIIEYVNAIRKMRRFEMLGLTAKGRRAVLDVLPRLPFILKWMRITTAAYAQRFSDPFLRKVFGMVQYDFPEMPMLVHINFMGGLRTRNFGWTRGGSGALAHMAAKRFEELGGVLQSRSRVTGIVVKDDTASGIVLTDGTQIPADIVIAACDGRSVIYDMLGGKYTSPVIDTFYREIPDRQEMNFHVSLGLNRDMSSEPTALTLFLEKPVDLCGKTRDHLNLEIINFDPSFAPAGKTVVKILLDASYREWMDLRESGQAYDEEKKRIAQTIISSLEFRFPGIGSQVEMIDVATPVTVERYTGNCKGGQAGFPKGKEMAGMTGGWCTTLPKLKNFYLTGQWSGGIGISTGAVGGRRLIRRLCREDGIPRPG